MDVLTLLIVRNFSDDRDAIAALARVPSSGAIRKNATDEAEVEV